MGLSAGVPCLEVVLRTMHHWGFRGKANTIPGPSRTAFRDDSEHDSGMTSNRDSDGKPNTFRAVSEWVFDIIAECFPQA
jgi:hypothetical protein